MKIAALTACLIGSAAYAGVTQFSATISGDQQVPPNESPVTGSLSGEYDSVDNTFTFSYELEGDLIGEPAAPGAHLHMAPPGENGPIVFPFATGPWEMSGMHTWSSLSPSDVEALFAGNIYINFHTTEFPGGEVRGQIIPAPAGAALLGAAGLGLIRRRR